jgi:hypothetical protein
MGSRASNGTWGLKILESPIVLHVVGVYTIIYRTIFHSSLAAVLNKDYTVLPTEVTKLRFVLQSEDAVISEKRSDR